MFAREWRPTEQSAGWCQRESAQPFIGRRKQVFSYQSVGALLPGTCKSLSKRPPEGPSGLAYQLIHHYSRSLHPAGGRVSPDARETLSPRPSCSPCGTSLVAHPSALLASSYISLPPFRSACFVIHLSAGLRHSYTLALPSWYTVSRYATHTLYAATDSTIGGLQPQHLKMSPSLSLPHLCLGRNVDAPAMGCASTCFAGSFQLARPPDESSLGTLQDSRLPPGSLRRSFGLRWLGWVTGILGTHTCTCPYATSLGGPQACRGQLICSNRPPTHTTPVWGLEGAHACSEEVHARGGEHVCLRPPTTSDMDRCDRTIPHSYIHPRMYLQCDADHRAMVGSGYLHV